MSAATESRAEAAPTSAVDAAPYARVDPYGWYVLALLAAVYALHTMDRGVFVVVLQPVKREFQLSDTELGFLAGLSYALPYAIAAVPLGMLADRVNRRKLLAVLVAAWSLMTAMGGFAQSFWTLVLARIGVGLAEAGGQPTAMSIIGDYIPKHRRTAAAGIFMSGTGMGTLIGLAVTGAVAAAYGWRQAFFVVGLPGVLLALMVFVTLREPVRGAQGPRGPSAPRPARLQDVVAYVASQRTLPLLLTSTVVAVFANAGVATWIPTFLVRLHGLSLAQAGAVTALITGLTGVCGALGGAWLADRVGRVSVVWPPRLAAGVMAASGLAIVAAMSATSTLAAVALIAVWGLVFPAFHGVAMGLTTALAPARMRGATVGIMAVLNNVVGYGLGPQSTGLLSDALHAGLGVHGLSYAIAIVGGGAYFASAILFSLASVSIADDISRVLD